MKKNQQQQQQWNNTVNNTFAISNIYKVWNAWTEFGATLPPDWKQHIKTTQEIQTQTASSGEIGVQWQLLITPTK